MKDQSKYNDVVIYKRIFLSFDVPELRLSPIFVLDKALDQFTLMSWLAEEMKHPSYTVQETLLVSMTVLTEKILVLSVKQVRCLKMCNDDRLFVVIPFFFKYSLLENLVVCMIPHNHRYRYIYNLYIRTNTAHQ